MSPYPPSTAPSALTHTHTPQTLSSTAGRGFSDHVNALLVGVDLLKKALEGRQELAKARARKRLLLLGTFDTQVCGQLGCRCVGERACIYVGFS